ncbi:MAG: uroporphyrinogen-III C-methyltransferase [Planctomycetota bacterium]|nr:MAG: uroporphyrinogen-III C-methyltransferase [Planctomycetota bacterium]
MGKVYLVGAGPGDLELLTLKAMKVLKKADVVLYDRLVNPEILELTRPGCLLEYVGKEDGKHLLPQPEINRHLTHFASRYDIVVRLKGGDPFVFGRGGEEAIYLQEQGIDFEIIPGISSSIAAAAYAGIPVTHRGVASSFAVITGHECPEKKESTLNWESFIGIDTLVFLMGVRNRQKIAQKLVEMGRNPKEAVAFVENGTMENQKTYVFSLKDVAEGKALSIHSPAIMIVGEVVKLREKICWLEEETKPKTITASFQKSPLKEKLF